jgi:hypothetical protein
VADEVSLACPNPLDESNQTDTKGRQPDHYKQTDETYLKATLVIVRVAMDEKPEKECDAPSQ